MKAMGPASIGESEVFGWFGSVVGDPAEDYAVVDGASPKKQKQKTNRRHSHVPLDINILLNDDVIRLGSNHDSLDHANHDAGLKVVPHQPPTKKTNKQTMDQRILMLYRRAIEMACNSAAQEQQWDQQWVQQRE